MNKILSIFFVFIIVIFVKSCDPNDPFKATVSGDFVYSKIGVRSPENNVAIIGLSDVGKTKETIVFPTIIDGYHVAKIGTNNIKRPSGAIIFNQAKNIYFPSINFTTYNEFQHDENATLNIYVGSSNVNSDIFSLANVIVNSKIFVKKQYYDDESKLEHLINSNYLPANVAYYLSDNLEDSFFVDDADGTTVNVVPPNPYKEGYEFVGWHKDIEGMEPWDFKNDVVPPKVYDAEGNYIFVETKIYAFWQ